MGIVKSLLRREHREPIERPVPITGRRPDPPTPLALLLPDAGGIATYQLYSFPSAKAAEFFLDSTLRGHVPEGAVLFWALNWQPSVNPDYGTVAEPLVVIRDVQQSVVYPFSFNDVESANDFVRHEMRRGLDLCQVMIYWAVPARIEVDFWGRSTIVPPSAPVRGFRVEHGDLIRVPEPEIVAMAELPVVEAEEPVNLVATIGREEERYLTEADIADVVGLMQQLSGEVKQAAGQNTRATFGAASKSEPAGESEPRASIANGRRPGQLIDFPTASHRLRSRDSMARAWGNFSLAIDEALDVYVARQVSVKLAWNRITRALQEALEMQTSELMNPTETEPAAVGTPATVDFEPEADQAMDERKRQVASMALANLATGIRDGMAAHAVRREKLGDVWATASEALASAAGVANSRKGVRRAWLNISWTMEEAVYAHALEQKARAIHAWRNATAAIVEAVETRERYEAAISLYWSNGGTALYEAGEAFFARQAMFRGVWSQLAIEFQSGAKAQRKHQGIVAALANIAQAIEEAVEAQAWRNEMIATWDVLVDEIIAAGSAKLTHDGLVLAWDNTGQALDEVCRAYVQKQKRAIRAWGRIATGIKGALEVKARQDAAIEAWTNIGITLREYAGEKQRHDGLVLAWHNAGRFANEVVLAKKRHDALVRSWVNLTFALREAVEEKVCHDGITAAWSRIGDAMESAVRASVAKQIALEQAWVHLSVGIAEAVEFKLFRERSIAAWNNAALAMGEAGNAYIARLKAKSAWRNASRALVEAVPVYQRKMGAISAWTSGSIAIKEAIVAEAKMRIAQAGLDKEMMAEVERAVKEAQKAVRLASKHVKKAEPVVKLVAEVTSAPALSVEAAEIQAISAAPAYTNGAHPSEVDQEPIADDESDPSPPADWKSTAGRWEPREEPFQGFQSPPGRFYRKERGDDAL